MDDVTTAELYDYLNWPIEFEEKKDDLERALKSAKAEIASQLGSLTAPTDPTSAENFETIYRNAVLNLAQAYLLRLKTDKDDGDRIDIEELESKAKRQMQMMSNIISQVGDIVTKEDLTSKKIALIPGSYYTEE